MSSRARPTYKTKIPVKHRIAGPSACAKYEEHCKIMKNLKQHAVIIASLQLENDRLQTILQRTMSVVIPEFRNKLEKLESEVIQIPKYGAGSSKVSIAVQTVDLTWEHFLEEMSLSASSKKLESSTNTTSGAHSVFQFRKRSDSDSSFQSVSKGFTDRHPNDWSHLEQYEDDTGSEKSMLTLSDCELDECNCKPTFVDSSKLESCDQIPGKKLHDAFSCNRDQREMGLQETRIGDFCPIRDSLSRSSDEVAKNVSARGDDAISKLNISNTASELSKVSTIPSVTFRRMLDRLQKLRSNSRNSYKLPGSIQGPII